MGERVGSHFPPASLPLKEGQVPPYVGTVTAACDMEEPRANTKGPPFSPLLKRAHRWLLKSSEERRQPVE